jgi:hypothetical protein
MMRGGCGNAAKSPWLSAPWIPCLGSARGSRAVSGGSPETSEGASAVRQDKDTNGVTSAIDISLVIYQGFGDMDAMVNESRLHLFYKVGKLLFGRNCGAQALDFALHRIGQPPPKPVVPFDPQLVLDLKKFSTAFRVNQRHSE